MTPVAGTAVSQAQGFEIAAEKKSLVDRTVTWADEGSRGEAGDTAPFRSGSALSKYRGLWRRRRV